MLRAILLTFGLLGCALVVSATARYAYLTTDTEADGLLTAALFAFVATAGVGGHAVAVRIWRHSWAWSVIIGLVSLSAMLISLTNSLGYVALRGSSAQDAVAEANRKAGRAAAELSRLTSERALITVVPTSEEQVKAARRAVTAAERDREAECTRRGDRCREREGDERRARETLSNVEGNLAKTIAAAELDAKIVAAQQAIATLGPQRSENAHGRVLAAILSLPADAAARVATWQQAAFAVVFELVIVTSLVAAELMGGHPVGRSPAGPASTVRTGATPAPPLAAVQSLAQLLPLAGPATYGKPSRFFGECVALAQDASVPVSATLVAYRDWCRREGLQSVDTEAYAKAIQTICEKTGIGIEDADGKVVLVGVKLAEAEVVA